MKYQIAMRDRRPHYWKCVSGTRIKLPVDGTYAIRKHGEFEWKVDQVETGCTVCSAWSRYDAIRRVREIVEQRGPEAFTKAIKKRTRQLKKIGML